MTATPSQEWTATTGESAAFRDLILKACFDLGFHGLRVDNPDAVASLASLVANASRLGSVVDNAELSAEVALLRAENDNLRHANDLLGRIADSHDEELDRLRAENEQLTQRERQALDAHNASFSALARISFATSLHGEVDEYSAVAEAVENELSALRVENERLMEWQSSVLGRLEQMPEFRDATWAGDKRGWGFVFEFVGWMHREIKSLRSQLAATREERDAAVRILNSAHE